MIKSDINKHCEVVYELLVIYRENTPDNKKNFNKLCKLELLTENLFDALGYQLGAEKNLADNKKLIIRYAYKNWWQLTSAMLVGHSLTILLKTWGWL